MTVEVFGCAVTQAEAASVRALLLRAGHDVVDTRGGADAAVVVTCTVVERTERKVLRRLREAAASAPILVVTGCMAGAQAERILDAAPHALVLPPAHLGGIVDLLEEGRYTPAIVDKAGLPRVVDGNVATIVINDGCLARCGFCITKRARPGLTSYPIESVVAAVEDAVAQGAAEVRLTSMDTGAWGRDLGAKLPDLLRRVAEVDGRHRLRLGMLNPFLGLPFLDDLLDALAHPRYYRFLHVPVQSGSERILAAMGRRHTADDVLDIARRARDVLGPDVAIWTDVIAGYPGETDGDHAATVDLLRRLAPAHVNVTRFSPRPGTPAADLPLLHGPVVKARSRALTEVRDHVMRAHLGHLVGRVVDATVVERVRPGTVQARTDAYAPIAVAGDHARGDRLRVRVDALDGLTLTGVAVRRLDVAP